MKNTRGAQPNVLTGPTPNTPVKVPEVADMEHFHRLATSGALSDLLFKMGGGKRK